MTRLRQVLGGVLIVLGGLLYLMRARVGLRLGPLWISAYPAVVLVLLGIVVLLTSRWKVR